VRAREAPLLDSEHWTCAAISAIAELLYSLITCAPTSHCWRNK